MPVLGSAFEAISKASKIVNMLMTADKAIATAETKKHLADVLGELTKLQVACQEKDAEIAELKQQLHDKTHMKHENGCYIEYDDEGDKVGGPYCQVCWERDHKKASVKKSENGIYYCYICKRSVETSEYTSPQPKTKRLWYEH
jgi:DNA repair exonuclease SbcCD ATPase subunit